MRGVLQAVNTRKVPALCDIVAGAEYHQCWFPDTVAVLSWLKAGKGDRDDVKRAMRGSPRPICRYSTLGALGWHATVFGTPTPTPMQVTYCTVQ